MPCKNVQQDTDDSKKKNITDFDFETLYFSLLENVIDLQAQINESMFT